MVDYSKNGGCYQSQSLSTLSSAHIINNNQNKSASSDFQYDRNSFPAQFNEGCNKNIINNMITPDYQQTGQQVFHQSYKTQQSIPTYSTDLSMADGNMPTFSGNYVRTHFPCLSTIRESSSAASYMDNNSRQATKTHPSNVPLHTSKGIGGMSTTTTTTTSQPRVISEYSSHHHSAPRRVNSNTVISSSPGGVTRYRTAPSINRLGSNMNMLSSGNVISSGLTTTMRGTGSVHRGFGTHLTPTVTTRTVASSPSFVSQSSRLLGSGAHYPATTTTTTRQGSMISTTHTPGLSPVTTSRHSFIAGGRASHISGITAHGGQVATTGVSGISRFAEEPRPNGMIMSEKVTETEVRVPKKIIMEDLVEKMVIVPEKILREEFTEEIIKVRQRIIEVEKKVQKEVIVEVPEIQYVERIIEVPELVVQEKIREVPRLEIQERIIEIPKIVIQDKLVEVPEIEYREIPYERIVEVPQIQEQVVLRQVPVPQYVEKPVPEYVNVEVVTDITRNIPVPVETTTALNLVMPQLRARYSKVDVPLYVPRFIEIAVPVEIMDDMAAAQSENYAQQVSFLASQNAASLCEFEKLGGTLKNLGLNTLFHSIECTDDMDYMVNNAWLAGKFSGIVTPEMIGLPSSRFCEIMETGETFTGGAASGIIYSAAISGQTGMVRVQSEAMGECPPLKSESGTSSPTAQIAKTLASGTSSMTAKMSSGKVSASSHKKSKKSRLKSKKRSVAAVDEENISSPSETSEKERSASYIAVPQQRSAVISEEDEEGETKDDDNDDDMSGESNADSDTNKEEKGDSDAGACMEA